MRRKEREITNFQEIIHIVDECEIIHIGLADGDYPYIVPLNFAYKVEGQQLELYIHGAMAGRKYEMLQKNPHCSFEMDNPLGIDCVYKEKNATMRYRSVMGKADVYFLEGEERRTAMDDIIMTRYEETKHFDYNRSVVARTAVAKLVVTEITAKANPMRENIQ